MNPHPETETETQAPSLVRLDDHTIDALARRVAVLIGPSAPTSTPSGEVRGGSPGGLLSAAQVAERFNVDRDWVYAHADQLGARRLGTGPKPRLRFDPGEVAAYLEPASRYAAPRTGQQ
jgi:hypothetical protein